MKVIHQDLRTPKPKKKTIDWYGKKVTVPFDCKIYPEKQVTIANRFTGQKCTMPGYAAALFKLQAASSKLQAASKKVLDSHNIHDIKDL